MNSSSLNIYILTFIYFALSLIGILNHEIWLDEAHHWLLSKESTSLTNLMYNTRNEGHPRIWNLIIYYISRYTSNPFWMQFSHIIISTTTIFIFLKKAPFSILFRILFIFGYFMFFEYNLLSRNYMLGVLFLFLALSLYKKRHENFILFSFFLALSSNVHLIFIVLSFALFLIVILEHYENQTLYKQKNIFAYLIFIIGISFSLIQIIPTHDSVFFEEINNLSVFKRVNKGFIAVWKGLITIPDFRTLHFWNTNIFVNTSKPIAAILGLFIYFLPLIVFYKNKKILFYVYISILGAQLFFFITQRGTARSHGMIYLIFIIGLWIEKYHSVNPLLVLSKKIRQELLHKLKYILVYSILLVHLFSGVTSYFIDIINPFTPAKEVVSFLKKNNLQNKPIITNYFDSSISAYTGEKMFSLCSNNFEIFINWNQECENYKTNKKIISYLKEHNKVSYIYISFGGLFDEKYIKSQELEFKVSLLKGYNKSIVPRRNYHIYELKLKE